MDWAQHTEKGYGSEWKGVLFRQTYPQLEDVIAKTKKWFPQIFPRAKYNESKSTWTFPSGEQLLLRHMLAEADYWAFHGWSIPWIGWEELTTWPDDTLYRMMMSCSRSTRADMPRKIRATTNPYGVGHNWVKARFQLPVPPGRIVGHIVQEKNDKGEDLPPRVAIRSVLSENKVLLKSDPGYIDRIRAAAPNPSALAAWEHGDWDIVAGGMFSDLWQPRVHVVPMIPFDRIPTGWRIDRSYDHGQSKPFSVGWWAQSNGEPIEIKGKLLGTVRGDVFRIAEWYGWSKVANVGLRMTANEIATGIRQREKEWRLLGRVKPGAADSAIYDDYEPGKSVAGDMARCGVRWIPADKGSGSRKQGWEQMRLYLKNAVPVDGGIREYPGLFICENCHQFLRTVPPLPRDEKDLDDVDTEAEDHIADEARYRMRGKRMEAASSSWR